MRPNPVVFGWLAPSKKSAAVCAMFYIIGPETGPQALLTLLFRPPVRSNGRSYKMLVMFLFFRRQISELPRPITAKLCHMIGTCVNFINWLQKLGELSPLKNWGPKTCKISVDFIQPPTLIANISGTDPHIENRKSS